MKTRLTAIALVGMMIFGLGACGGKKPQQSSNKEITEVVIGGQKYNLSGTTFSWHYPKTGSQADLGDGAWPSEPTWPVKPVITHTGTSISPAATADLTLNTTSGAAVTYTVTAEDGTTKSFKISATRDLTL